MFDKDRNHGQRGVREWVRDAMANFEERLDLAKARNARRNARAKKTAALRLTRLAYRLTVRAAVQRAPSGPPAG